MNAALDPEPATLGEVLVERWSALGTSVALAITDASSAPVARRVVERELAAIDLACSRFRTDSELSRINAASGRPVPVSPLFAEALVTALRAAELTDGDVDPTLGAALARAGYDRDFSEVGDKPPIRNESTSAGGRDSATARSGAPRLRLRRLSVREAIDFDTGMSHKLRYNPIKCEAHGLCTELLPELIALDEWGYPIVDPRPVPKELLGHARRAVDACPTLALLLEREQE